MHILLIKTSIEGGVRIPQGLLYLASAIHSKGYKVTIHDEALVVNPEKSLAQILSYDADIVGLSVYTEPWNIKRATLISRAIKAKSKSKIVIWGGWHPTLYSHLCINNEDVDIVVRGPGEKIICELLKAFEHKRSLRKISGLLFREKNEIFETGPECLAQDHLYPPLNFSLINIKAYLKYHDQGSGILQYVTSRGCHGRCRFCCMAYLFKGFFTRKPKNLIVHELCSLIKRYEIKEIHFSDDNAFKDDTEAHDLSNIIDETASGRNLHWRCAVRIDTLSRLSDHTYQILKTSGCKGFSIGIESGSDRVLRLMRKGFKTAHIREGLRRLASHSLDYNLFFFMVGFPGESSKESPQTIKLARQIRLMFPKSDLIIYVYRPWAPDASLASCSPLSTTTDVIESLEKYYAEYVKPYRVAGKRVSILNHYLIASRQPRDQLTLKWSSLKWLYRKLAILRVKYGIFSLPFEYYLSSILIKRAKKLLASKKQ